MSWKIEDVEAMGKFIRKMIIREPLLDWAKLHFMRKFIRKIII